MSAPTPLEHVPDPPWLGEDLSEASVSTAEADGLASWSDVGGLGSDGLEVGDGGGNTFNLSGAMGTAASQYEQSLVQGKERWEQALRVFESAAAAFLDVQLGQIHPLVPVVDTFGIKPLARAAGIDFSISDTISAAVRTTGALIVHFWTGRHEELARVRARAEAGALGTAAKLIAETVNALRKRPPGDGDT